MSLAILLLTAISSMMLSMLGAYHASGALLIGLSVYLYAFYYKRSKGLLLSPGGLFALSWIGGAGVSALKLSNLQTDWELRTWAVIVLFGAAYLGAYELVTAREGFHDMFGGVFASQCRRQRKLALATEPAEKKIGQPTEDAGTAGAAEDKGTIEAGRDMGQEARFTAIAIYITTAVSVLAFLFEAWKLRYIPLFTVDTPHAYSYFHVTGVHYFTTAFVLIPAEAAVYFSLILDEIGLREGSAPASVTSLIKAALSRKDGSAGPLVSKQSLGVLLCVIIALLLPILLVSRFQLLFSVFLCIFCVLMMRRDSLGTLFTKKRLPFMIGFFALLLAAYVFLTIQRAHSVEYLKSIFDMRYDLPIWISQPYIYVANNFDNLNCLIRDLPAFSGGLRMLYPVLVFTGIKFTRPELVSFPLYVTKEELATFTIAYDAYYDFGLPGIVFLGAVLGYVMGLVEKKLLRGEQRGSLRFRYVMGAQPLFYICLSFFTTWYSNPSTWFYLGASAATYIFIRICMKLNDRRAEIG